MKPSKNTVVMASGPLVRFNCAPCIPESRANLKPVALPTKEYWTTEDIQAHLKMTPGEQKTLRRLGALVAIPGRIPWRYTHESVVRVSRNYVHVPLSKKAIRDIEHRTDEEWRYKA